MTRRVVQANPALARELRIGRPDLPRQYDDGGLVDVNRVPGYVLAASLGLTQQEVANLIAARDKLGNFGGADERATTRSCRRAGLMSSAT